MTILDECKKEISDAVEKQTLVDGHFMRGLEILQSLEEMKDYFQHCVTVFQTTILEFYNDGEKDSYAAKQLDAGVPSVDVASDLVKGQFKYVLINECVEADYKRWCDAIPNLDQARVA